MNQPYFAKAISRLAGSTNFWCSRSAEYWSSSFLAETPHESSLLEYSWTGFGDFRPGKTWPPSNQCLAVRFSGTQTGVFLSPDFVEYARPNLWLTLFPDLSWTIISISGNTSDVRSNSRRAHSRWSCAIA